MYWINDTQNAINFIENNLLEDINADDVSKHIHSSSDHFQRTFNIVTGISINEYIRNRRLTLAGEEIINTQARILDVSMKYGYDSPDSFTKAFTRFHGVTPTSARAAKENLKHFYPLSIKIFIKGGFGMSRKIISNIPEIDNNGNEVDYVFNLLQAVFAIMGTKVDKSEIAVHSGIANRFVWVPGRWAGGNESIESTNETPFETEIRIFKTFGWDARYITVLRDGSKKPLNTDNKQIRYDFVDAIDKDYPVLYRTVHCKRLNIIIGYEDNGSKIICKDAVETAGVNTNSETVFRDNWEDIITEYILLKEKTEPAPERERALCTLELIVNRARSTDYICNKKVGLAAWESFLHDLEFDDFSQLTHDEIRRRMGIYCDGLCQIWGRNASLPYYRQLAENLAEWRDELAAAVTALDACANYGGFLWTQGHSFDESGYEKFRDPAARKILADEGRKAMLMDMKAVEQFEKILAK